MSTPELNLPRLPRDEEGPVFAEPWQAQAFARAPVFLWAIQRNNSTRKEGHKRLPVIVVNPDEGAMATFAKLVGSGVQFFQTSLQNYVAWLREQREG